MTTGTVYALVDPRDNRVRYIGATTQPLKTRLYGHLKGPASRRVKAWVKELGAVGLTPRIEPIHAGVATSELRESERAEITRRLIAGEKLLNESATAPARRHIERQQELDRQERERAAWEHAAHQVRSIVGGPLPPGNVVPIPLDARALQAHHKMLRLAEALKEDPPSRGNPKWEEQSSLSLAREKAGDTLWKSARRMWGPLRGIAEDHFDYILAGRVRKVLEESWTDLDDAARYLALLPWGIMAVGPWAALAERAGMDATGTDFIDWVSDDATVREALTTLLLQAGDRMGPLSVLDNYDNHARPSAGLVVLTAAHHPGFDLPETLHPETIWFLNVMLRGGQLSPSMAELLIKLEPCALDRFLGPNLASAIDAQLGLSPGTSRDVMEALLRSSGSWQLGRLDRVVARANGAFPTVATPSFSDWGGPTTPMFRAIVASLVATGVTAAPSGTTRTEYVSDVCSLWCADLSVLKQTA